MEKNKKKGFHKAFKYTWLIAGLLLLIWTLYFFIKTQTIKGLGVTAGALLFAAGLYGFLIYIILTMMIVLVREIIKRLKHMGFYEK
jgi:FtsH-binding integral membrane protein